MAKLVRLAFLIIDVDDGALNELRAAPVEHMSELLQPNRPAAFVQSTVAIADWRIATGQPSACISDQTLTFGLMDKIEQIRHGHDFIDGPAVQFGPRSVDVGWPMISSMDHDALQGIVRQTPKGIDGQLVGHRPRRKVLIEICGL
ncbi:MAG: hypothetical protein OEU92_07440 [Alphaproteobacteria bacterium]|nr:hypothetical protein [Alphaproteobacteria bacterium]